VRVVAAAAGVEVALGDRVLAWLRGIVIADER
jgi:hypothetical protein